MGMDVHGVNPRSERGAYFRANVWSWRPIVNLCEKWFPDLWGKIEYPHTNDGSGLNEEDSRKLGKQLKSRIELGELKQFIAEYNKQIEEMEDELCTYCGSTGQRMWDDGPKECNACHGKRTLRPFAASYGMDHDHISEFADFLIDCGGFEIW